MRVEITGGQRTVPCDRSINATEQLPAATTFCAPQLYPGSADVREPLNERFSTNCRRKVSGYFASPSSCDCAYPAVCATALISSTSWAGGSSVKRQWFDYVTAWRLTSVAKCDAIYDVGNMIAVYTYIHEYSLNTWLLSLKTIYKNLKIIIK